MRRFLEILLLSFCLFTTFLSKNEGWCQGVKLAETYKATLDFSAEGIGRDWISTQEDVWSLSSFAYAVGNQLQVLLGPSTVVFGKHGTDVVWAAVIPDEPGKLIKAPSGTGESITSIFLRFHPQLVQRIFKPETVQGNGPAEKLIPARRIYQYKINAGWQTGNLPVIPEIHSIILDCETVEGSRRRFEHNTQNGKVEYHSFATGKPIPDLLSGPLAYPQEAEEIFLAAWKAFDQEYAMFGVKPNVDWAALKDQYLPIARKAKNSYEAAGAVALLLAHLEDLHVSVKAGEEYLWCYNRFRPMNGNWNALRSIIGDIEKSQDGLAWGQTKDRIGYICVLHLPGEENGRKEIVEKFDRILDELKETHSLILDLRFNGGGDEPTAQLLAGRFVDKPRTYSLSQFRSGKKHGDLGRKLERIVEPRGPWRYEKPVITLTGQRTMSSAESYALMMAQCPQATTLGDRTAGSSGCPRLLRLPADITVRLPRWLDMDPKGNPLDFVGIKPEVVITTNDNDFKSNRDPVLQAALKRLRQAK
jgi:hypothetical protein